MKKKRWFILAGIMVVIVIVFLASIPKVLQNLSPRIFMGIKAQLLKEVEEKDRERVGQLFDEFMSGLQNNEIPLEDRQEFAKLIQESFKDGKIDKNETNALVNFLEESIEKIGGGE